MLIRISFWGPKCVHIKKGSPVIFLIGYKGMHTCLHISALVFQPHPTPPAPRMAAVHIVLWGGCLTCEYYDMWAANLKPRWDLHYVLPLSDTRQQLVEAISAGRLNKDIRPHN